MCTEGARAIVPVMNTLVDAGFSPRREGFAPQPLIQALLSILPAHCVLHREGHARTSATACRCTGRCRRWWPCRKTRRRCAPSCSDCKRMNVPIVARGAGTGLSGGAMPHAQGVLLGLSKLNRIKRIDPAGTAVVEPGVRNLAISEAAALLRAFYYARTHPARSPVRSRRQRGRELLAAYIASSTG